ncbi:hypothetical protein LguiB_023778 [Lonicera macranthoides]
MESETLGRKIEETIIEILKNADLETITEYNVRSMAADRLGIDFSDLDRKWLVRRTVESFLLSSSPAPEEQTKEVVREQQQPPHMTCPNEDGGRVICKLSEKRSVSILKFGEKNLVSVRDCYQKDGKQFQSGRDSGREFRDTVRDLNQAEAARRFERDQGMPSGPGQSSRFCSLPALPRTMSFTAAWEEMQYNLRSSPTPERFTFSGIPSEKNVIVSIDELRSLYDTATDYWAFLVHCVPQPWEYDRSFRDVMRLASNAAAREAPDPGAPSRSSMGSVNEAVLISRPAPRRRGPPSRRSQLGSAENVDMSSRRGS